MLASPSGRRTGAALTAAFLLAPLAACSSGSDRTDTGGDGVAKKDITVLAASSLTDVFDAAGTEYEKSHPDTRITFSFAGSQVLAAQVSQGAPADVLATANTRTMESVGDDTGQPVIFARNRLVIVVREGNPEDIDGLEDLTDPGLKVVLAAPEVPVGGYSKKILDREGLDVEPVSRETNVRAVLSKVELGEADAGLVYRTDAVTAPGKVDAVAVPDGRNEIAKYPVATLNASEHSEAAQEFVGWLTGADAQRVLREAGFQKP
ncbi:hypothetical protein N566_04185 [Streptomycetaceae bacterium MP113-05]|nr:hypothetical protein N566_04185 [Streptomycetaceae bacterium MP113-05]